MKLDVLVVFENTLSTAEERASFVDHVGRFVAELETAPGGMPDVHLGVLTGDVGAGVTSGNGCAGNGDAGRLQYPAEPAACTLPDGNFIIDESDGSGGRVRNYDTAQSLSDTFACLAALRGDGCAYQQPLESLRLALEPTNTSNAGFRRADATLAVLFVTDEDDCSATTPQLFDASFPGYPSYSRFRCTGEGVVCGDPAVAPDTAGDYTGCRAEPTAQWLHHPDRYRDVLLATVGGDAQRVVLGALVGAELPFNVAPDAQSALQLSPSCTGTMGPARPPVRIAQLLDAFPGSVEMSLCASDDVGAGLAAFGQAVRARLEVAPGGDAGVGTPGDDTGGCCGVGGSGGATAGNVAFAVLVTLIWLRREARRRAARDRAVA